MLVIGHSLEERKRDSNTHPLQREAFVVVQNYREKETTAKMWTVPLISVKAKAHRLQKQHFNLYSDSTFIHGSWLWAGISLKALIDFIGLVRSGKVMEQMHFLCFQNFNNGSVNKFTMKMQRVQPCTDKEKWTSSEWLKDSKMCCLSPSQLASLRSFPQCTVRLWWCFFFFWWKTRKGEKKEKNIFLLIRPGFGDINRSRQL